MRFLLALAAALALLFGCIGVPQEKYDALKSSCEQEKKDLTLAAEAAQSQLAGLNSRLSSCTSSKEGIESLLKGKESELEAANARLSVLDRAKEKAGAVASVQALQAYYNDAFSPGKIVNSIKISRIEQQLALINDASLTAGWKRVINCGSLSECDNAKANFTAQLDAKISQLALETVSIVKQ